MENGFCFESTTNKFRYGSRFYDSKITKSHALQNVSRSNSTHSEHSYISILHNTKSFLMRRATYVLSQK